ncbi:MAG TPA: alkaline phosphatase family protein [Chitinophagales bacterium]|nr:alkaline phosphatase family protein [Chitinophagales bacterium]
MKKFLPALLLFISICAYAQQPLKTENVILVTWDGYRWQELFGGVDKMWMTDKFVKSDIDKLKSKYAAATREESRRKLMPFFWDTIAAKGTLIGNRWKGSKMRVTNIHKFSYPGYSEIFCGHAFNSINSNEYPNNPHNNIFDFVAAQKGFEGKIAAFGTWDAFPRIINSDRNKVPVFVNFKKENNVVTCGTESYKEWQTTRPAVNPFAETDSMTYHFAKEYLHRNHPRFAFIGFDETDHFGHGGQYDAYLETAAMEDRFIADLWAFIQSDPQYKDKTTLIITCDHGRGNKRPAMWRHHGQVIATAHNIWLAAIGPDVPANGEVKGGKKYTQSQIAQTIARLLGTTYTDNHPVAKAIDILVK